MYGSELCPSESPISRKATHPMRKITVTLLALASLTAGHSIADEIQVILRSDKPEYKPGETVNLSLDVLWLGAGDGVLYFNSLAFPELEVLYLNRSPVEMTVTDRFIVRPGPSRHEVRVFAPTMQFESAPFSINTKGSPTRYLDGRAGYYDLDRQGPYVIRATFGYSTDWKLHEGQTSDIRSSAVVIRIAD